MFGRFIYELFKHDGIETFKRIPLAMEIKQVLSAAPMINQRQKWGDLLKCNQQKRLQRAEDVSRFRRFGHAAVTYVRAKKEDWRATISLLKSALGPFSTYE